MSSGDESEDFEKEAQSVILQSREALDFSSFVMSQCIFVLPDSCIPCISQYERWRESIYRFQAVSAVGENTQKIIPLKQLRPIVRQVINRPNHPAANETAKDLCCCWQNIVSFTIPCGSCLVQPGNITHVQPGKNVTTSLTTVHPDSAYAHSLIMPALVQVKPLSTKQCFFLGRHGRVDTVNRIRHLFALVRLVVKAIKTGHTGTKFEEIVEDIRNDLPEDMLTMSVNMHTLTSTTQTTSLWHHPLPAMALGRKVRIRFCALLNVKALDQEGQFLATQTNLMDRVLREIKKSCVLGGTSNLITETAMGDGLVHEHHSDCSSEPDTPVLPAVAAVGDLQSPSFQSSAMQQQGATLTSPGGGKSGSNTVSSQNSEQQTAAALNNHSFTKLGVEFNSYKDDYSDLRDISFAFLNLQANYTLQLSPVIPKWMGEGRDDHNRTNPLGYVVYVVWILEDLLRCMDWLHVTDPVLSTVMVECLQSAKDNLTMCKHKAVPVNITADLLEGFIRKISNSLLKLASYVETQHDFTNPPPTTAAAAATAAASSSSSSASDCDGATVRCTTAFHRTTSSSSSSSSHAVRSPATSSSSSTTATTDRSSTPPAIHNSTTSSSTPPATYPSNTTTSSTPRAATAASSSTSCTSMGPSSTTPPATFPSNTIDPSSSAPLATYTIGPSSSTPPAAASASSTPPATLTATASSSSTTASTNGSTTTTTGGNTVESTRTSSTHVSHGGDSTTNTTLGGTVDSTGTTIDTLCSTAARAVAYRSSVSSTVSATDDTNEHGGGDRVTVRAEDLPPTVVSDTTSTSKSDDHLIEAATATTIQWPTGPSNYTFSGITPGSTVDSTETTVTSTTSVGTTHAEAARGTQEQKHFGGFHRNHKKEGSGTSTSSPPGPPTLEEAKHQINMLYMATSLLHSLVKTNQYSYRKRAAEFLMLMVLEYILGVVPFFNCKSGVDRTGCLVSLWTSFYQLVTTTQTEIWRWFYFALNYHLILKTHYGLDGYGVVDKNRKSGERIIKFDKFHNKWTLDMQLPFPVAHPHYNIVKKLCGKRNPLQGTNTDKKAQLQMMEVENYVFTKMLFFDDKESILHQLHTLCFTNLLGVSAKVTVFGTGVFGFKYKNNALAAQYMPKAFTYPIDDKGTMQTEPITTVSKFQSQQEIVFHPDFFKYIDGCCQARGT